MPAHLAPTDRLPDPPKTLGFRRLAAERVRPDLFDCVLVFEPPRNRGRRRYVIGADVGDGLGGDRSVATVARVGTIEECGEEVAQYATDHLTPTQFAYVVEALGRAYSDEDGIEAQVAVECNNHGLSTQDTLQLHLGYGHFYRWEYYDAAEPAKRYSTKIGWLTTPRTRPILLDKFFEAVTTLDPITGAPDYRLNSPHTRRELATLWTPDILGNAEAARGKHDDAIFSSAIAYYVSWRLAGGEQIPLADRRRMRSLAQAALEAQNDGVTPDWRDSPVTLDEMRAGIVEDHDLLDVNAVPWQDFSSY